MILSESNQKQSLDEPSGHQYESNNSLSHNHSPTQSSTLVVSEHDIRVQQPHKILRLPEPPYSVLCARPLPSMKGILLA